MGKVGRTETEMEVVTREGMGDGRDPGARRKRDVGEAGERVALGWEWEWE